MWKWIVGGLLVVVVLIAGTCYYAMKKLGEGGNATRVTIGATPERVFAAYANADSMALWMTAGSLAPNAHGVLKAGDTLQVAAGGRNSSRNQSVSWVVSEIHPPFSMVLEIRNDSSRQVALLRRDSLASVGDSTVLTATFTSPAMDSLRAARGDTTTRGNIIERAFTSLMRLLAETDLKRLKAHIEGKPMPE
jgi:uncharacterized protein YndB with AHSA1/START domain